MASKRALTAIPQPVWNTMSYDVLASIILERMITSVNLPEKFFQECGTPNARNVEFDKNGEFPQLNRYLTEQHLLIPVMKQLRSHTENPKLYETQTGWILVFDRANILEIIYDKDWIEPTRYVLHFMKDWKTYWSGKHKRTNEKAKAKKALTIP